MWPLDEAIVEWMERVRDEREEKYGTKSDDREQVPMMGNAYARDRK